MPKKTTVVTTDSSKKGKDDKKNKASDIIGWAVDCLDKYQERESDNIHRAEEAIRFRAGDQWPEAVKRDRENPHQDGGQRPCPVMDKVNQYVRQIVNEERQTRAAIRTRPVDDKADPKVAEIYNGIIRHIEDASDAQDAYTTAGEHAIDGGFGYWRIITKFCDPMSFDQDIRIKRIPNRFSVALGPHTEPDGSDCREALIWEDVPEESFKAQYPDAKLDGFQSDQWKTDETIRVAEYMRIIETRTKIYMMPDGKVWTSEELAEQGLDSEFATASRETVMNRVRWYKLTASEVLDERDMIGSHIPVVKVIGNELTMPDGTCRLSGAVEAAMDPQRLHNYSIAGFIENVALAPRAPWTAPKESIKGMESDYAQANRRNVAVLTYNHVDDAGNTIPRPVRTQPAGMSPGWAHSIQFTEHGVEAAFGMYGPSVGAKSQEKSGIALQEQKQQGMVGNYHFPDNLSRSIQHTGRILVEWIPKVYDTERVARMLGEDGNEIMAYLNPEQEMPVMPRMDRVGREVGKTYNLNVGKYDVTVATGPSYTAKRQESVDNQLALVQTRPDVLNLIGDQLYSNMDFPGADKIARRFKVMLPPQVQQAEAEGEEDQTERQAMEIKQAAAAIEQQARALFEKEQQLAAMEEAINEAGQASVKERTDLERLRNEIKVLDANMDAEQARIESARKLLASELKAANMERQHADSLTAVSEGQEQQLINALAQISQSQQALSENLTAVAASVTDLATLYRAPKRIEMEGGEITSVGGRPAVYDNDGNLIGLGSLN